MKTFHCETCKKQFKAKESGHCKQCRLAYVRRTLGLMIKANAPAGATQHVRYQIREMEAR